MEENIFRTTLNGLPIAIDLEEGRFSLFGLPAIMIWLNPSLYRMLAPLVQETGIELARLLIAHESNAGADEDYRSIVTLLGPTFTEGFVAWGKVVRVCGWGKFELLHFDLEQKRATVRVRNAWELIAQAGTPLRWGCPFLQGKVIGIFRHALGANCWADEYVIDEAEHVVEYKIYSSDVTIAGEIARLRRREEDRKQVEVAQLESLLQEKQQTILQLSTPVMRLSEGILLLPLVGRIDEVRAKQLMENVLAAIADNDATEVIIDITGVPFVDANVANSLMEIVRAAKLVGAECMLVGISAAVAQMLVQLEVDLGQVRTFSNLERGLNQALERQRFRIIRSETGARPHPRRSR